MNYVKFEKLLSFIAHPVYVRFQLSTRFYNVMFVYRLCATTYYNVLL